MNLITGLHVMTGLADASCRLRYAPTPSGYLHAGNALNFFYNYLVARARGGRILVRIDDLDADRKRPEYVQDIFDSLHWLGLDWDEGPRDPADFEARWSQHHRLSLYEKALDQLRETGLLFACRKSRRELASYGGRYPAEFREQGLSLDDPDVAWRIRTPDDLELPDFVVRRRDGLPAYQVASLVDDRHFGITHLIRGEDLQPSTLAQTWLAGCLKWEMVNDMKVYHHPLLLDAEGEKLSKSAGSASLRAARERGETPESIYALARQWLDVPVNVRSLEDWVTWWQSAWRTYFLYSDS